MSRRAKAVTSAIVGFEVGERRELRGRVHVAQRDRDEPGRHARAHALDVVGVAIRASRIDLDRIRDLLLFRDLHEQARDLRVDDRSPRDRRSRAELDLAGVALVVPRDVGGPGDVDHERCRRLDLECRRPGPVVAGLLLHRRDRDDVDLRVAGLLHAPCRFEHGVGAEAVVQRARHDAAVRQLERLALPDAHVAGGDPRPGLLLAGRADVDREVVHLRAGVSFAPRALAHRDHAVDRPFAAGDRDALAGGDRGVKASDRLEGERPEPSACVIVTPISSMCPIKASAGRSPVPTRATEVPSVSLVTSANDAAALRQTRAAASSWPEGAGRFEQVAQQVGDRHGLRIQPAAPIVGAVTPSLHGTWWTWRASGAGACA